LRLVALEGKKILVPAVWSLEIANAILTGERQKRLGQLEVQRFITLLASLPLTQDVLPANQYVRDVLPLAREYGLSAYDAAYLELSIRQNAPLATLDKKLRNAAQRAGKATFEGDPPE
jgi:predicted nucleic acid-binding protein